MNREIKLRVFNTRTNEWHYVDIKQADDLFDDRWSSTHFDWLSQYTGLKDKNGKEIWENDIVITAGYRSVVKYEAPHFTCRYDLGNAEEMDFDVFEDIEVIGNIFEDNNLLKDKPNEN